MKITVITVTYNCASTLQATIDSVVNQTYSDIEYIIVDGASTDGTLDIIKANENKITRWISESDKGIYDAMNKGIDMATGDYINFMNAGDSFYSIEVVSNIFNAIPNQDIDYIYGDAAIIRDNKVIRVSDLPTKLSGKFLYLHGLYHQSTLIKASLLKQNKYNVKYKIIADQIHLLDNILMKGASYFCFKYPISYYDNTGMSSTVNFESVLKERIDFMQSVLPPMVCEDYFNMHCYQRDNIIGKITSRIKYNSIAYKLITLSAIFVYVPITLFRRFRNAITFITNKTIKH